MNAKKELKDILQDIKCATITYIEQIDFMPQKEKNFILKVHHTEKELKEFIESLDFNYDNSYGGQQLFGTIWLNNNTWLTRGEYDGSEWWNHHKRPTIPSTLIEIEPVEGDYPPELEYPE